MCWTLPSPAWRRGGALALLLWAAAPWAALAQEQPLEDEPLAEAFLVTYGPGTVYWQRFGHNAIWLREPHLGLDHTFNFGFFDFDQENFLLRFVQGRMLYFSAAISAEREIEFYQAQGRSIRVQTLDLDRAQYRLLRDHLLEQVKPENRDYLYDYYLDNCSTRLRDALDLALGGALQEQFLPQAGLQSFRGHTRRSTAMDFWYYLGLETALGAPVDRPITRWLEMFLPAMLADNLAEVTVLESAGLRPVVSQDVLFAEARLAAPPAEAPEVWPRYLALSLGLLAVGWLLARFAPAVLVEGLMQAWMLNAGVLGCLMLAVWVATDHTAAHPNANLLLLNPLMLLALVPALRRQIAFFTALLTVGALVVLAMPWLQYMRDIAALMIPLNLACAARLWRFDTPPPVRRRFA